MNYVVNALMIGALLVLWYAAYKGHVRFLKIFWLPKPYAQFKIGGRIDQLFLAHFAGHWLLCVVGGWPLSLLVGLGLEVKDGFHSEQGADPLDLLADILGILGWSYFSGLQIIKLVGA